MRARDTVTAAVLLIGDELLSGRTRDVNLGHIAERLTAVGIDLREARFVPDVEDEIVAALDVLRARYDYVFTTGGIGPTHDDITADCVAKALGRELYLHPDIESIIRRREAPPEVMASRLRMARVPEGAALLENPFGPHGFRIENVFVMAGIPRVMHAMLTSAIGRLEGGKPVRSRSITAFVTESQVASPLGQLQARYPDLDIGSYPFSRGDRFGTSLVARGTDVAALEALAAEIRALVEGVGGEIVEEGDG